MASTLTVRDAVALCALLERDMCHTRSVVCCAGVCLPAGVVERVAAARGHVAERTVVVLAASRTAAGTAPCPSLLQSARRCRCLALLPPTPHSVSLSRVSTPRLVACRVRVGEGCQSAHPWSWHCLPRIAALPSLPTAIGSQQALLCRRLSFFIRLCMCVVRGGLRWWHRLREAVCDPAARDYSPG